MANDSIEEITTSMSSTNKGTAAMATTLLLLEKSKEA